MATKGHRRHKTALAKRPCWRFEIAVREPERVEALSCSPRARRRLQTAGTAEERGRPRPQHAHPDVGVRAPSRVAHPLAACPISHLPFPIAASSLAT